jgi:hypothetical protein
MLRQDTIDIFAKQTKIPNRRLCPQNQGGDRNANKNRKSRDSMLAAGMALAYAFREPL